MPARRAPTQALPEFIAPQLATLVPAPPKGVGWVYEIKLDGYRVLARINGKDVRMFLESAEHRFHFLVVLCEQFDRVSVGRPS